MDEYSYKFLSNSSGLISSHLMLHNFAVDIAPLNNLQMNKIKVLASWFNMQVSSLLILPLHR
jgi:hypothetical protein